MLTLKRLNNSRVYIYFGIIALMLCGSAFLIFRIYKLSNPTQASGNPAFESPGVEPSLTQRLANKLEQSLGNSDSTEVKPATSTSQTVTGSSDKGLFQSESWKVLRPTIGFKLDPQPKTISRPNPFLISFASSTK